MRVSSFCECACGVCTVCMCAFDACVRFRDTFIARINVLRLSPVRFSQQPLTRLQIANVSSVVQVLHIVILKRSANRAEKRRHPSPQKKNLAQPIRRDFGSSNQRARIGTFTFASLVKRSLFPSLDESGCRKSIPLI